MPKSSVDDLVPKLQAVARGARRHRRAHLCARRQKVDYGTMMKVMGRLSAAGFHRVALVTEFEQGSKVNSADEDGVSDLDRAARGRAAVGAGVLYRQDLRGDAGGIAAGRPGQREGILRDDQGHQGRAQAGREAQAAGREDRRAASRSRTSSPRSPRRRKSRRRRKRPPSRRRARSPIRSPTS